LRACAWFTWLFLIMTAHAQTNLIQNGDFRAGDAFPSGWKFESGAAETFEVRRLAHAMELRSLGADTSGYLVQVVPVEPGAWYRLTVTLRQNGGRGLLWVNAKDAAQKPVTFDAREYVISFVGHPLVPRFVSKELMRGSDNDEWREQSLEFFTRSTDANAAPIAFAKVNIGCYFSVSQLWISQVSLTKLDRPAPE
jgi:hypothetical protein